MVKVGDECYFGIIYKIENTITHYVYIGQTTSKRGFNGRYDRKGVGIERVYKYLNGQKNSTGKCNNEHLLRSMKKCGLDCFVVNEVFDTANNLDELNAKEAYYINAFDSFKHGYNQTYGGDSMGGVEKPKGRYCKNSKKVCQISLDGEYIRTWDSATEASNELNIDLPTISNVCNGKNKTAGGYVWCFEKDYNPSFNYKQIPQKKDKGKGTKPVLLLSEDGSILKRFYSVNKAGEELHISPQDISRACNHKTNYTNLNLIFENEYMEEQRLTERTL